MRSSWSCSGTGVGLHPAARATRLPDMNRPWARLRDGRSLRTRQDTVVAALSALAALAVGAFLSACAPFPPSDEPRDLQMMSPTVGWGFDGSNQRLARTTDGGRTWTYASP